MRLWPLALLVLASCAVSAPPQAKPQPTAAKGEDAEIRALLDRWLGAVRRQDYAVYGECLHGSAHEVEHYGSRGAMFFFRDELASLAAKGFADRFEIARRERTARAFLVIDGARSPEHLLLAMERGKWRILRILPGPPPN